jgi:hypothetical protein
MKKIKLTQNKWTLIDDEDFELVNKYKWRYVKAHNGNGYAHHTIHDKEFYKINKKRRIITLNIQNLIMNPPKGMLVDHINNDGLDNRRCNLRICSYKQNTCNKRKTQNTELKYKGISKYGNRFRAQLHDGGKRYSINGFKTQKEAAIAYNKKAIELFGEFANLNKI